MNADSHMTVLIRAVPWDEERFSWAQGLVGPAQGQLVLDRHRDAYATFLDALRAQERFGGGAWHLEDDIILTNRWHAKARWEAMSRPYAILQGYSDRKDDVEKGSRWAPGSGFMMNQCFWIPAVLVKPLREYAERTAEHFGTGYDTMMARFMVEQRLKYWIIVPSLVQHRQARSVIDPRRSSKRQSRTFQP